MAATMKMRGAICPLSVLGLSMLLLTGCGGKTDQASDQPAANPGRQQPPAGEPPASATQGAGVQWTTPAGWVVEQPSSQMRKAQYRVPGPSGDAEVAVFYFGAGQGGDAMTNATRWANQFTKADGSPALDEMKTRDAKVNGMPVLFVEVEGTYTNTMVGNEPHPDHELLGAIVKGPDANWFFKLTGPASTVENARADFDAMIESIH